MEMVKEFCPESKCAIIRSGQYYGSELTRFLNFAKEAMKDFPFLTTDDIKIVHYGGSRYSGTFGIEFAVGNHAPEDYKRISQLQLTLS